MDTNRIVINNYDASTATISEVTNYCGFTVVRAEKGPCRPVRVAANDAATIQDIFGVSSKDYPELYEAEVFNEEFDTYISAPYGTGTKIPVAYVTSEGIFVGKDLVNYTADVEKIAFGDYLDENIPGITSLTDGLEVKVDAGYPAGAFGFGTDLPIGKKAVEFIPRTSLVDLGNLPINNYLKIYTGIAANEESGIEYLNAARTEYNENTSYYKLDSKGNYIEISKTSSGTSDAKIDPYLVKKVNAGVYTKVEGTDPAEYADAYDSRYNSNITYYELVEKEYVAIPAESAATKIYTVRITEDQELPCFIKNEIGVESLASKFEQKVKDGKIEKLVIEGAAEDLIVGLTLKSVEVLNDDGTVSEDPDGTYIVWKRADGTECTLLNTDNVGYLYIPLTSDEANWYGVSSNLEKVSAYWDMKISTSNVAGTIFPKYPSARTLTLEFADFDSLKGQDSKDARWRNYLKFTATEEGAFQTASITGSLDDSAKDANGAVLAFSNENETYAGNNLVAVFSFGGFKSSNTFEEISGYGKVVLSGGIRTAPANLNSGWNEAKAAEYSVVNVFFDSERHTMSIGDGTQSPFFGLANVDIHPLAGYIFNITPASLTNLSNFSPLSYGPNYWSICNEAVIDLANGRGKIVSPMTGARARMQVRIIENRWGGVAPMFLNSDNLGGQIPVAPAAKLRFAYTKNQQDELEKRNMNPVVKDTTYGIIVTAQRTCKAGEITDWSYIGHVSAFLDFEREVREDVMIPQIGKANNDYYRTYRKAQVENILNKRLSGNNRIWAAASVDTSTATGVNDVAARRARKFIINVRVKVDVFSEFVEFNFTNVDQSMEV